MSTISKWFRKFASVFAEKPVVQSNDFELEHFLLYHGLVGRTPENQREFKDVRADIRDAVDNKSSVQLAISLKLAPLWWEERLKSIFSELPDKQLSIALLAPPINEEAMFFDDVPILHSDWQVRANAAILLAHLEAKDEFEKVKRSLDDTVNNARLAFCHQAYALARLGHPGTEQALSPYLRDEDPWIRVDAAGALAESSADRPSLELLQALLSKHTLSDYTAVAVSRSIRPIELLTSSDKLANHAACGMIVSLLDAAKQTFGHDIVVDTGTHECLPLIVDHLSKNKSPQLARTALLLAEWLESNRSYTLLTPPPQEAIDTVFDTIRAPRFADDINEQVQILLREDVGTDVVKKGELENALQLVKHLQVMETAESLEKALSPTHPLLDEIIEALAAIGNASAANKLIDIANSLVDMDTRVDPLKQAQPVQESDQAGSKTYWLILKELGKLPYPATIEFLLRACGDFAPDKRAQALESLAAAASNFAGELNGLQGEVQKELASALADPSPEVRKTALRGIRTLGTNEDLKKVVSLTKAKEVSVGKEAFQTLSELAKKGHKTEVLETVKQALRSETDVHRRNKLKQFIEHTQG